MYDKTPTFREFVSYLLATDSAKYNIHWLPVHLLCRPCTLHCKDRDHWERQQENKSCPIFDIFIFITIIFSDSSGRLSAMVIKKKEPKRWSISQRFFSQLEKKGGGSDSKVPDWLGDVGLLPPEVSWICKKLNLIAGVHLVHLCWALAGLSNHNIFGKAKRRDFYLRQEL